MYAHLLKVILETSYVCNTDCFKTCNEKYPVQNRMKIFDFLFVPMCDVRMESNQKKHCFPYNALFSSPNNNKRMLSNAFFISSFNTCCFGMHFRNEDTFYFLKCCHESQKQAFSLFFMCILLLKSDNTLPPKLLLLLYFPKKCGHLHIVQESISFGFQGKENTCMNQHNSMYIPCSCNKTNMMKT